jgi:hexosaminidase
MDICSFLYSLRRTLALAALLLMLAACQTIQRKPLSILPLIPLPALVDTAPGSFTLHEGAVLNVRAENSEAVRTARYFSDLLARTRGIHLDVRPLDDAGRSAAISFVLDPRMLVRGDPGDEGYELTVSARRIEVAARTAHGLFNGAITLWQWLGTETAHSATINVPCVHIEDHPRFAWRGLMLDSARHFQTPEFVEHLLDQMAQHKLNVFHWHLTDDQGWRIQIKKYPRLTEVGAWRTPARANAPSPYGGFYTQQQIRDVVAYAAARYITIVPEIEMPGHAQATIAAYPEFGVDGRHPQVSHDWGVHTYLYNVDDATFGFLEDVLTEVMDLFPGPYVHVGGDEAAKDQWQASASVQQRVRALGVKDEAALQGWFTARIEKFLGAHGRRLIGWDEILEGGVPPRATVMSWRGIKGAIDAAQSGHDVVMAPSPSMYFDHVQSSRHDEPPGRPDVVSLADVYAFDALPAGLDETQARHVLGAQANLWTEYMDTPQRVEHAAFPRAAALAEALWTPAPRRDWADFQRRLPAQFTRYRVFDIAAADSIFATTAGVDTKRRNSDELAPCKPGQGLALRLPGPPAGEGVYRVDIFDPCWIYPGIDLAGISGVSVVAGELPYNFQLWKDIRSVVSREPAGQLQVRLDSCTGDILANAEWSAIGKDSNPATFDVTWARQSGVHDLCFIFNRASSGPLWAIDSVQLQR